MYLIVFYENLNHQGQDYTPVSQTINLADGQANRTADIPITNDLLDEPTETVNLSLSNPTGEANLASPSIVVLNVNDNAPTVSINDVTLAEGNQGTTNFVFNINLSAPSGFDISLNYATANGAANAPVDYAATSGTLNFSPATGETSKILTVFVNSVHFFVNSVHYCKMCRALSAVSDKESLFFNCI